MFIPLKNRVPLVSTNPQMKGLRPVKAERRRQVVQARLTGQRVSQLLNQGVKLQWTSVNQITNLIFIMCFFLSEWKTRNLKPLCILTNFVVGSPYDQLMVENQPEMAAVSGWALFESTSFIYGIYNGHLFFTSLQLTRISSSIMNCDSPQSYNIG